MEIEEGKFYFIKQDFFDMVKDKLLLENKNNGNKRPCYYCFKDSKNENIMWCIPISSKVNKYESIYNYKLQKYGNVDNIVFGYVEGEKRAFLIQNIFPITKKYITEIYIKQNKEVSVNKELQKELKRKSNKILRLTEKGYTGLIFTDIETIVKILNEQN